MKKDEFFDYLVGSNQLDEFLELEDWQKEEVKSGRHDSWNFEEDDCEDEDDYYHEDDE